MQQFWWVPWFSWRWSGVLMCLALAAVLVWVVSQLGARALCQLGHSPAEGLTHRVSGGLVDCLGMQQWPAKSAFYLWWMVCLTLAAGCGWYLGASAVAVAATLFCVVLAVLALIDTRLGLLPDILTLGLLWAGLLVNCADVFVPLKQAVPGAAAGYLVLWALYWGFFLATGREGLGYGDFKLSAALGAWLGWQALPVILFVASLTGLVFALWQRHAGRLGANESLSFGPWLAVAGIATLFSML